MCHFSLSAFKIFFYLWFQQFDYAVLTTAFLVLTLLRVHRTSWVCKLIFSTKFEEFGVTDSFKQCFWPFFFFPSPFGALISAISNYFILSYKSLRFCSLFFNIFLSSLNWVISFFNFIKYFIF